MSESSAGESKSYDWIIYVGAATLCWALSDICSDAAITTPAAASDTVHDPKDGAESDSVLSVTTDKEHEQLTAEQGALVSICITFAFALALHIAVIPSALLFPPQLLAMACVGGVLHFLSYLLLLKAFECASSTEITPLLQLSAAWLFPLAVVDAVSDGDMPTRPLHLLALVFIVLGGLLPVTAGKMTQLLSWDFWRRSAVGLCVLSELMVAVYSMLLHQNSFDTVEHERGTTDVDVDLGNFGRSDIMSVVAFFVVSRYASVAVCILLCLLVPRFRAHLINLFKEEEPTTLPLTPSPSSPSSLSPLAKSPSPIAKPTSRCLPFPSLSLRAPLHRVIAVKCLGDVFSVAGLLIDSMAYALFYEPSVINATEGGLQQLLNLGLAITLSRLCRVGRPVSQVGLKLLSLLMVLMGLVLSCRF